MSNQEVMLAVIFYGLLLVSAIFAFVYGVISFFKKGKSLYAQLVTCGMGCFVMAYIFQILQIFITKEIETGFQVGNLGIIGAMAFFFTASFGELDDDVDDEYKSLRKYRLLAFIAPLVILIIYLPSLFSSISVQTKIFTLIQFIFIGPAAYYSFKHLIIPDVDVGIVKPIRAYNLVQLLMELFLTLELGAINFNGEVMAIIFVVILSILFVISIPLLKKGASKWTQQ